MRKLILDALKAKFEGVSEAVLSRIADKIAKTVAKEEDVTTAVEGITFNQVLESYGDSRATEAQQTAVTNYEKKHGLKDGQKVEGGALEKDPDDTKPGNGGDDLSKQIQAAVTAAMKPLTEEITALKAGKVSDARKQQLNDIIANAPEKFRERIGKDYGRMTFGDDEEFNSWLEEVKADADAMAGEMTARGAVFGQPVGGGSSSHKQEPTKEDVDTVMSNL